MAMLRGILASDHNITLERHCSKLNKTTLDEDRPLNFPYSVVSDKDVKFAYKGLFGCSRLIATTDPLLHSQHCRANNKTESGTPLRIDVSFWNKELATILGTKLAPQILQILLSYEAEKPMLTAFRAKYEGCVKSPVVLLVFVKESTLSREAGAYAAQECLNVLKEFELCRKLREEIGILIEICEGEIEDRSSLYDLGLDTDPRRGIPGLSCATLTGSPVLADRVDNTSYVTAGPIVTDLETNDVGMISVQHSLCQDDLPYRIQDQQEIAGEPPEIKLVKSASQLYTTEEIIREIISCKQEIEIQISARNLAEERIQGYLTVPKTPEDGSQELAPVDPAQLEKVDNLIFQNGVLNDLYANLKYFEILLSSKASSTIDPPHIGYICFAPGIGSTSLYQDGFHHDYCLTQIVATQETEILLKSAQFIDLGQEYDAQEIFRRYRHKGLRLSQLPRGRLLGQTGTYWTEDDFMALGAQPVNESLHQDPFLLKAAAKSGFSILKMLQYPIFRSQGYNGEVSKSMLLVSLDEKDVSQWGDSGAGVYDLEGRSVCLIQGGIKNSQLIVAQPMFSIMSSINKERPNVRLFGSHCQMPIDNVRRPSEGI